MNTDLKICFVDNSKKSRGSYRIWINDLNQYLTRINVNSKIVSISDAPYYDVVIFGKNYNYKRIDNKKIGLINPPGYKRYDVDFIITGSLEEADSLSSNDNVFLFPLIEDLFHNKPNKHHTNKNKIKICYHGHQSHLASFEPYLKQALEEFSRETDIELLVIHGDPGFNWTYGRPNIPISFKRWSYDTILSDIQSCDIGICPNASVAKEPPHKITTEHGLFNTDYLLRFKNKSNAGRAFVFHQLGIPTIADLTPSHFHVLGNPDCGYIAMSKNGWLSGLRELSSARHRNFIAGNARKEFDRLYDPLEWSRRLYSKILDV
jgi:hypothetical protein